MANNTYRPAILSSSLLLALSCSIFEVHSLLASQREAFDKADKRKIQQISSHVILVSISGLRSDFMLNAESYRLRIPTIQSLRANGSFAVGVEPVFPSQTGPAHATIATGTLPADHGITSDHPFDEREAAQSQEPHRLAKDIKTDTIWELARRANLVTAAVGYPLTVNGSLNFNVPDHAESEVRSSHQSAAIDSFRSSEAAHLVEKYRPNLLLINFTSFDAAQRRHGLLSVESVASLEMIDGFVKKIVEAVERAKTTEETTFIIVSDYGAAKIEREFSPNVALAKKGWLTPNIQGKVISWRAVAQTFSGSAAVFVKNPQDEKFVREVEEFFSQLYEKPDSPIWRVIPRRDAARLGADPRAALYLDAAPSYAMSPRTIGPLITKAAERAAHGYSPSRSEMRATFAISGKGVKPGIKIEYARLIDIAPTISRLLGLEMKTARGRVMAEVINQ